MKSVKWKISILVLSSIIISSFAIGGASLFQSRRAVNEDSVQIMNLLCENRAHDINEVFTKVEQSVSILHVFALRQMQDVSRFKQDPKYVQEYTDYMLDAAINAALSTQGAITVYIRFDPTFTNPQSGFFYQIDEAGKQFLPLEPTDLSKYDPFDLEHVGWFYEPIRNQAPLWMEPYHNSNIDEEIISYVIPIKVDDIYIGVVGMDIALSQIEKIVSETSVYDSGYAFLADRNARIIYHKELTPGVDLTRLNDGEFENLAVQLHKEEVENNELLSYTYAGVKKKASFQSLENGLRLILTVPEKEIDKNADILYKRIVCVLLTVILLAIVFTELFTRRLVKPLIELNIAAKKIAAGDFSVTIHHQSKDEVGDLAESFRQTTLHLNSYVSYINKLAYTDVLTGFQNKTSYFKHIKVLDEKLHKEIIDFGVVVFDINDLKVVNDTYGHVNGDYLIVESCHVIAMSFSEVNLYRIGGDEFVAVLEAPHCVQIQTYIQNFQTNLILHNADVEQMRNISIAWGMAVYDASVDHSYIDVFNRADTHMYQRKLYMKNKKNEVL